MVGGLTFGCGLLLCLLDTLLSGILRFVFELFCLWCCGFGVCMFVVLAWCCCLG